MSALSKKTRLLSLAFLFLAGSALAAPDEETLGKWQGYPVCTAFDGAQLAQRCLVGLLSNWDQLATTHKVARGETVAPLKRAPIEPGIAYKHRDTAVPGVDDFLSRHRNTGLLILSGDTILYERYQYDRKPEHRFHSFSMAKTVVAMLVGVAVQEGKIGSIDDLAEKYVPALHGTPYGMTSLRHLLTMSSGMRFVEEYSGADDVARLSLKTYGKKGAGGADTVSEFRLREAPAGTRFKYVSADRCSALRCARRSACRSPITSRARCGSRWARRPTRPGTSIRAATSSASPASTPPCAIGAASACSSRTTAR
jgi:beta-lactamase family protein